MKKLFIPIVTALSLLVTSPALSAPDPFASYNKKPVAGITMTCYVGVNKVVWTWAGNTLYINGLKYASLSGSERRTPFDAVLYKAPGQQLLRVHQPGDAYDIYLDFGRKTQTRMLYYSEIRSDKVAEYICR